MSHPRLARLLLLVSTFLMPSLHAATINGFPVDNATVPVAHLKRAAPAKDSIPALDAPRFLPASEITQLEDSDHVFSLTINGETRAYPLPILVWHEVVNDRFGDTAVTITYSALTGTVLAFSQQTAGVPAGFGVSGILYNSGLLFYDRATQSLWSQLLGSAIAGPCAGEALIGRAGTRQTWASWKTEYPNGVVLWPNNDRAEDYEGDWPYGDYATEEATIFPFDINRRDFKTKVRLVGLVVDGKARAWPAEKLATRTSFYDSIGTRQLRITHDEAAQKTEVRDLMTGELLPAVYVYWFAWQAFYPETSIWLPLD